VLKLLWNRITGDLRGSFKGNLLAMFTGSAVTVLISFFFTPVIARLYSPEIYGEFSLFRNIASNLALLIPLGLVNALILPRARTTFYSLLRIIGLLTAGSIMLMYGGIGISYVFGFADFLFDRIGGWLWFLPLFVAISIVSQVIQAWNTRLTRFRIRSTANVVGVLAGKILTVSKGYNLPTTGGLVLGETLFLVVGMAISWPRRSLHFLRRVFHSSREQMKDAFQSYREYPVYVLPANYINLFATQLPIFLVAFSENPSTLGQLTFALSIINIPVQLIAKSFAPVFLQKLVESESIGDVYISGLTARFFRSIFYLGFIPFSLLLFFGEDILLFFLGDQWHIAGSITQIMVFAYFLTICTVPLSVIYRVKRKERTFLGLSLLAVVTCAGGYFLGYWLNGFWGGIIGMTVGMVLSNLMMAGNRNSFNLLLIPMVLLILLCILILWLNLTPKLYAI